MVHIAPLTFTFTYDLDYRHFLVPIVLAIRTSSEVPWFANSFIRLKIISSLLYLSAHSTARGNNSAHWLSPSSLFAIYLHYISHYSHILFFSANLQPSQLYVIFSQFHVWSVSTYILPGFPISPQFIHINKKKIGILHSAYFMYSTFHTILKAAQCRV